MGFFLYLNISKYFQCKLSSILHSVFTGGLPNDPYTKYRSRVSALNLKDLHIQRFRIIGMRGKEDVLVFKKVTGEDSRFCQNITQNCLFCAGGAYLWYFMLFART